LDMDCIIKYHQCVPSWFTVFIPSYFMCFPCWGLTCFAHPFSLVSCQYIQHNSLPCIFVLPFLLFIFSTRKRWWKRPLRDLRLFASIHGNKLKDIKNIRLEQKIWLLKDQKWHQILFHLH
jgi:hypothetical protein